MTRPDLHSAAPRPLRTGSRWQRAALILGLWTAVGLFFTLQSVLSYLSRDYEVRLGATLIYQLGQWYAWGLLTPVVLGLARRYPFDRRHGLRSLRRHLLLALALAPMQVLLALLLRTAGLLAAGLTTAEQARQGLDGLPMQVLVASFDGYLTYWIILALYLTFDYYRKDRERQLRTADLEARLAQAELQNLRMQLHPHFLFNTLHSISALVTDDPEAAERMIARLSELLRLTLESAGTQVVPLRQELAFLDHYLAIEKTRFQDRLTVTMDIAPDTLDAQVPNLVLQPLVENAIRYGVAPRPTAGRIAITASRINGQLRLQVRDDGPGLPAQHPREGVGLANTRARLQQLYPAAHRFDLVNASEGGLEVDITIPYHNGPAPA